MPPTATTMPAPSACLRRRDGSGRITVADTGSGPPRFPTSRRRPRGNRPLVGAVGACYLPRPTDPRSGPAPRSASEDRPDRLVADADLRGERAETHARGEGADRRILLRRQLAGTIAVPTTGTLVATQRWTPSHVRLTGAGFHDRNTTAREVLNMRIRPPSLPPARAEPDRHRMASTPGRMRGSGASPPQLRTRPSAVSALERIESDERTRFTCRWRRNAERPPYPPRSGAVSCRADRGRRSGRAGPPPPRSPRPRYPPPLADP